MLRYFKIYTSKKWQAANKENTKESRRDRMRGMMEKAGAENSNVKHRQFWQQNHRPVELWSPEVIDQKVDDICQHPVEAGFVNEPEHWKHSSAIDYSGGKGLIELD